MEKNDRGILWNFAFLNSFNNAGIIEKADENEEEPEGSEESGESTETVDELKESINDIFLKEYLKTIILEANELVKPPFKIEGETPILTTLGVTFEFNKVNFCEGCKRKDYINANRVTSMDGSVFLKFFTKIRRYNSSCDR